MTNAWEDEELGGTWLGPGAGSPKAHSHVTADSCWSEELASEASGMTLSPTFLTFMGVCSVSDSVGANAGTKVSETRVGEVAGPQFQPALSPHTFERSISLPGLS